MKPDINTFNELLNEYNLIPFWDEISCDLDTPISLYNKVCKDEKYCFLLESLEGGEKWGRYSIIGLKPLIVFGCKGQEVFIKTKGLDVKEVVNDPLEKFKEILKGFKMPAQNDIPRFFGGAVGFLGYDMVRFMEKLPNKLNDDMGFNDAHFIIPEIVLVHDNLKHSLQLITFVARDLSHKDENLYKKALNNLNDIKETIFKGIDYIKTTTSQKTELLPEVSQEKFEKMVTDAKEYILAGDLIQVVLSQRFSGVNHVPAFDIYRALRKINPSPYLYFLKFDDETIIGSSPEILVRLTGNIIELRPIAGTRKRGITPEEDKALEKDLLSDIKERAEHVMLVDLGRNDAGRVAKSGTVRVEDLMCVERYSHVMHIVSGVKAELLEGKDMFDVLRACFPAGTVSGAPKIRAMEIIDELEHSRRGPYAGSVGYFGFTGNMDMAITIRTLFQKGEKLYLQAGAGIVADSVPEKEWEETINKGMALMKALERVG